MGNNTLLLKYEDIILDKEKEVLKIIKFINNFMHLKVDKEKLENCIKTTSFNNMANIEKQGFFKENSISKNKKKIKFFNKGVSGDWKNTLNNALAGQIEQKFKEEMIKLKYI